MPNPDTRGRGTALSGVIAFLALYQGVVPLVVRLAFDGDQRFAPALWLPSPWWWIACIAVVVVAVALLAVIGGGDRPGSPAGDEGVPVGPDEPKVPEANAVGRATTGYDAVSGFVFLVGLYNGVAPFVARLVFDGNLFLAFPLRLRAPWWWITSLAVIITSIVLLGVIDAAKQRRLPDA